MLPHQMAETAGRQEVWNSLSSCSCCGVNNLTAHSPYWVCQFTHTTYL